MDAIIAWTYAGYFVGMAVTFSLHILYLRHLKKKSKWSYYNQVEDNGVGWVIFFALFWPLAWISLPLVGLVVGMAKLAEYLLERE